MPDKRSRPGAQPQAAPKTFSGVTAHGIPAGYPWPEQHAAYVAALDQPDSALIELLAEQRAHELIHERSVEMLGLARREAMRKGPAWARMIMEAGEEPWSA